MTYAGYVVVSADRTVLSSAHVQFSGSSISFSGVPAAACRFSGSVMAGAVSFPASCCPFSCWMPCVTGGSFSCALTVTGFTTVETLNTVATATAAVCFFLLFICLFVPLFPVHLPLTSVSFHSVISAGQTGDCVHLYKSILTKKSPIKKGGIPIW